MAKLIARPGRHASRSTARWPRSPATARRATGVRLAGGEDDPGRHRRVQCRYRPHLSQTAAQSRRASAGPTRKLKRARYSMSLFVWYFGTNRQYPGRAAPHHHDGPALPRTAARHLRAQASGGGLQPLSPPPHRDRSLAGARGLRQLLRALARAASGFRHRLDDAKAESYRSAIAAHLDATVLPGFREAHRDREADHAHRFRDPAVVLQGCGLRAGAGACCKAPGSAPTTGARTSRICSSSVPAPIRAPAFPASSPQPAFSTRWCPMRPPSPDRPMVVRRPTWPQCRQMIRDGSKTFYTASLLLPQRVCDAGALALCLLPRGR